MKPFVGRKHELKRLEDLMTMRNSSIAVIKGRRRIGKSRLAEEFGKNKTFLSFSGLVPIERVNAQDQRDTFAKQLASHFHLPALTFTDWTDAFAYLTLQLKKEKTVILFDEISWMGSKDPTFIPKLKICWDLVLQNHPSVVLILCGSISTWIDENIINSTAFFGRISLCVDLGELTLPECHQFLKERGVKGSLFDIFKILSITGGIPWYLELIHPHHTVDENIKRLCFEKGGILVDEFDQIFHDLFSVRGSVYKKITHILAEGMRDFSDIRIALDYTQSGSLSAHLTALETSGFVSKHYSWSIKKGSTGKKSIYRLCDNYLRFYIRYIEPNLPKIHQNAYSQFSLSNLQGWEVMMGFQLENLLLKNRPLLLSSLGIYPQDVLVDNPYIQRATSQHKGCQIDYLIQTHSNSLFICEIKMRKREIGLEVIQAMEKKIKDFARPKGFGICPVLFHLGPVSDAVLSSQFFYRIIDVMDFLELE